MNRDGVLEQLNAIEASIAKLKLGRTVELQLDYDSQARRATVVASCDGESWLKIRRILLDASV